MSATLNKVQLIGNIGAEPKQITTKEGGIFVTASLATNKAVKHNGEWETMVEWHQLIFFGSMIADGISYRATSIVVSNGQLVDEDQFLIF